MKVTFINKVRRTIEHYGMLDRGDRICVAVSGGPDSVALLQLLRLFADDYRLHLVAAHLNHGIRSSESHRDETFVRELCRSMNVPVRTGYVSVYSIKNKDGGSLEDICRRERFRYLKEVSREEGLNKIALGHNLNDQAETIIMRFLRGSGITGMKGILPIRDNIYVRPLLEVTREEILTFLECEGANYVTDSSNLENIYLRNRIRNRLIPELQDYYNARLVDNLGRMAHVLRMEDDFIEEATENVLKDWNISGNENIITIYIPQFRSVHIALQKRIIKLLLERMTLKSKGIGYLHVGAVMELIAGEKPNGFINLPFQISVKREYDKLVIAKGDAGTTCDSVSFRYPVEIPGISTIRESGIKIKFDIVTADHFDSKSDKAAYMDYDAIEHPLEIRNVRPGDRIQPFGMKGTKKIKDFFIDEKIPQRARNRIPLLVDKKSVLWIVGMKLSNRARVTDMTEKLVKAEII